MLSPTISLTSRLEVILSAVKMDLGETSVSGKAWIDGKGDRPKTSQPDEKVVPRKSLFTPC
jgi:hypothetical protein